MLSILIKWRYNNPELKFVYKARFPAKRCPHSMIEFFFPVYKLGRNLIYVSYVYTTLCVLSIYIEYNVIFFTCLRKLFH